jgi:hypothetical protein
MLVGPVHGAVSSAAVILVRITHGPPVDGLGALCDTATVALKALR